MLNTHFSVIAKWNHYHCKLAIDHESSAEHLMKLRHCKLASWTAGLGANADLKSHICSRVFEDWREIQLSLCPSKLSPGLTGGLLHQRKVFLPLLPLATTSRKRRFMDLEITLDTNDASDGELCDFWRCMGTEGNLRLHKAWVFSALFTSSQTWWSYRYIYMHCQSNENILLDSPLVGWYTKKCWTRFTTQVLLHCLLRNKFSSVSLVLMLMLLSVNGHTIPTNIINNNSYNIKYMDIIVIRLEITMTILWC